MILSKVRSAVRIGKIKELNNLPTTQKVETLCVILMLIASTLLLTNGISQGLWQDEAYTVGEYVDKGPATIITGDNYKPNNHILYTLSIWFVTSIVGFSELAVRLPSILASLAGFIIIYMTVRRYLGVLVAIFTLGLLTLGDFHALSLPMGRGYGYLLLLGSLVTYFALRYVELNKMQSNELNNNTKERKKYLVYMSIAGFLAIYTYPSYAVFLGCILMVLFFITNKKEILITTFGGLLLTILAFLPLLSNIMKYYVNFGGGFKRHDSVAWDAFITLPIHKVARVIEDYTQPLIEKVSSISSRINLDELAMLVIAAALIAGIIKLWIVNKSIFSVIIVPVVIFIVFVITFSIPVGSRTEYTIFIEPACIIAFCTGVVWALNTFYRNLKTSYVVLAKVFVVCVFFVGAGLVFLSERAYRDNYQAKNVPFEDARGAAVLISRENQLRNGQCEVLALKPVLGGYSFKFYSNRYVNQNINVTMFESVDDIRGHILSGNNTSCYAIASFGSINLKKIGGYTIGSQYVLKQRRTGNVHVYFVSK